tara:strand:- start:526 stop:690 length:165 start_codon:yes stop_codon:yes gene_type:complete
MVITGLKAISALANSEEAEDALGAAALPATDAGFEIVSSMQLEKTKMSGKTSNW